MQNAETILETSGDLSRPLFGPYQVFERIGVGGMATVHRAKEHGIAGFERIVALKRLLPHLAEDGSFVSSFVREAKFAAMLNHVNIVQLYELGRVGPHYFISMEYIEGCDVRGMLRQSLRTGRHLPLDIVISLLVQTCDALQYAHTRRDEDGEMLGLVHRDVSPSNLLVNDAGYVKVIDFGIAKARTEQMKTRAGLLKGKFAYMAPEVIDGMEADSRVDLFAVGVVAHELLTARPLFATNNDYETLQRVQNANLVPPSEGNPECPPILDAIVLKALARDREQRWQSAQELRDALASVASDRKLSIEPHVIRDWLLTAEGAGCKPVDQLARGSRSSPARAGTMSSVGPLGSEPASVSSDLVWEERSSMEPVLLDDVPDVSDRAAEVFGQGAAANAITHTSHRLWWVTLTLALVSALVWTALIAADGRLPHWL